MKLLIVLYLFLLGLIAYYVHDNVKDGWNLGHIDTIKRKFVFIIRVSTILPLEALFYIIETATDFMVETMDRIDTKLMEWGER